MAVTNLEIIKYKAGIPLNLKLLS